MGKRIQQVQLQSLGSETLYLGYVGENEHTQIVVNCAIIFTDYPDATASIVVRPPAGDLYHATITRNANRLIWEITSSDVIRSGSGQAQFTFENDGEVIRSIIARTRIDPSIEATGEAPEPLQNWMDQADAKAAEIAQDAARQAAVDVVEEAEAEIERVAGTIPADYTELSDDVDELKSAKADKATTPGIIEPEETEADLYVCDPDGNVIAKFVDGHIVTKNFDSSAIRLDLIMEADSDDADLYITDSFGNVVAEFKDGHIVTKEFDSSDYTDVLNDIESLLTDVSALKSATSGIMFRTQPFNDGVYASCRFFQSKQNLKQFCILAAGDIHADATRMNSIVEYLNNTQAFDAGIMLGDISGNTYDNPITFYTDAIANVNKPFLTVIGNHDVVGATGDTDLWNKYGGCFAYADLDSGEAVNGKCYYYKDFANYKIRIIVLMQYDLTFNGNLCFGQAQIDWLISTLNSTPSDYGVIIAEHTNPSRHMTYEMDAGYTSSTWKRSNYAPTLIEGDPVPDIVNAWINGTTLSQTYNYTFDNPPEPLSVSADFTNRGAGEFITFMGGHWHQDVFGHPTAYEDQPDWHMNCAGTTTAEGGDMGRKIGTLSEDSFCAIAVDRDAKTVKVFQIGAHFTMDAIDRQYIKYSYGGANA